MSNFKILLALTASLNMFQAFADSCIEDICSGETVIDSSNNITRVVGIDEEKNEIIVKNIYGTLVSVKASILSDEVSSERYPLNKTVLDSSNLLGKVKNVFRNGKIAYLRDGYGSVTIATSSQLAPETESVQGFQDGDRVIDSSNLKGKIVIMFANNTIHYLRDGYGSNTSTSPQSLSLRIERTERLSKGTRIIDSSNLKGAVTDMYADGRTFYLRDGYGSETMVSGPRLLILQATEYRALVRGTRIIDTSNLKGAITDIYEDGRIFYLRDGYGSDTMTSNTSQLVLRTETVAGLVKGSIVIDSSNLIGKVTDLYVDGRVFYLRNGYGSDTMVSTPSQLVLEASELNNGEFRVGTKVADSSNVEGEIKQLFRDGRMVYLRNGYGSSSIATTLFSEVSSHETYSKDVQYATPGLRIGKPSRFYSNGMVSLGGELTRSLYEEVQDYKGIASGSDVIALDKTNFNVKNIFSNGVISAKDEKDKSFTLRALVSADFTKENVENMIVQLSYNITKENKLASHINGFISADALELKLKMKEAIKSSKDIYLNAEAKMSILNFFRANKLDGETDVEESEIPAPAPTTNSLTYLVSIKPDSMIQIVKDLLNSKNIDFALASEDEVRRADYGIIIQHSKSVLSGSCNIYLKEGSLQRSQSASNGGLKDPKKCVKELKNLLN